VAFIHFFLIVLTSWASIVPVQDDLHMLPDWAEEDPMQTAAGYQVVIETPMFRDAEEEPQVTIDAIEGYLRERIQEQHGESAIESLGFTSTDCMELKQKSHLHQFRHKYSSEEAEKLGRTHDMCYRSHVQLLIPGSFDDRVHKKVRQTTQYFRLVWTLLLSLLTIGTIGIAWVYLQGMRVTRSLYFSTLTEKTSTSVRRP